MKPDFDKPTRLIKDTAYHVLNADLNLKKLQDDFQTLINDELSILALYYADEVAMNKGGYFYLVMNDSTSDVRTASHEMAIGNNRHLNRSI